MMVFLGLLALLGGLFLVFASKGPADQQRKVGGAILAGVGFLVFVGGVQSSMGKPADQQYASMKDVQVPTPNPHWTPNLHPTDVPDSTDAPDPTDSPEPTAKPAPEPTSYEQYVRAQKREFIAGVDESISGSMIVGNKFKYVGQSVDLHCTVIDVPQATFFNADCGGDSPLAIETDDVTSITQGQSVRVLGVVDSPIDGTNAYGGSASFAAVAARFIE